MLQILSTSNETSTGTELVQNGDFAEIGSDLVTNGDFSAVPLGSELVTYPNFTNSDLSQWIENSGIADFTWNAAEFMNVKFDIANGNALYSSTLGQTLNSYYNVKMRVRGTKADGVTAQGSAFDSIGDTNNLGQVISNPTLTSEWQDYEFNVWSTTTVFRLYLGSVLVGDLVDYDSISVKENINLVDNPNFTDTGTEEAIALTSWTAYTSGASTVTYDGAVAKLNIDSGLYGGSNVGIYQNNIFALGKSYKIVLSMKATASFDAEIVESNGAATVVTIGTVSLTTSYQNFTFYYVGTGTYDLFIHRLYNGGGASQTISIESVSVKELGADWTVTEDTGSVTFANDQVQIISDGSAATGIIQGSILSIEKSYKVTIDVVSITGSIKILLGGVAGEIVVTDTGVQTFYEVGAGTALYIYRVVGEAVDVVINSISVQELGEGWTLGSSWSIGDGVATLLNGTAATDSQILSTTVLDTSKSYVLKYTISNFIEGELAMVTGNIPIPSTDGNQEVYFTNQSHIKLKRYAGQTTSLTITNITVQELDPNGYWTLGTGWSIGADKAISTVTGSNSDITQSILTAGKTYQTIFEVVDFTAGTVQAVVTGDEGTDRTAIETYTESLTATGTDFSIRSKLGTFDGAVSSVSVKQLGTYEDQSIYVTAADVQTIAQASVYYLVELTSMGSKNSLYFIPSSVVPNNGRYTKLNFTVISKDALPQPTVGIISFYDSVGGLDTYPMGFYEFKIYEQTSSTNLDPLLATGLLQKGFAFVRDFSGNMQELTDGFKEYTPALTQYVYSK